MDYFLTLRFSLILHRIRKKQAGKNHQQQHLQVKPRISLYLCKRFWNKWFCVSLYIFIIFWRVFASKTGSLKCRTQSLDEISILLILHSAFLACLPTNLTFSLMNFSFWLDEILDDMGTRIDELEKSIGDLMDQVPRLCGYDRMMVTLCILDQRRGN